MPSPCLDFFLWTQFNLFSSVQFFPLVNLLLFHQMGTYSFICPSFLVRPVSSQFTCLCPDACRDTSNCVLELKGIYHNTTNRGRKSCWFSSIFPNWKNQERGGPHKAASRRVCLLSPPLRLKRGNCYRLWSNCVGSSILTVFTISLNLCKKSCGLSITVYVLQIGNSVSKRLIHLLKVL